MHGTCIMKATSAGGRGLPSELDGMHELEAVACIMHAYMTHASAGSQLEGMHELEAEAHVVNERASDVVLGLLTGRAPQEEQARA